MSLKASSRSAYLRGLALSASGMLVLSPDGLLLRLIRDATTWDVIFYRSLFIGISLTTVLAVWQRQRFLSHWRGIGRAGLLAAIFLAGGNIGFVGAVANTSVANTLVILAAMPFFAALLGRALIGERVRGRTWVAIGLAMGGILIIFAGSLGGGTWRGDLLAVFTTLMHALNLVALRMAGDRDMTPAVALGGILAALAVAPFASFAPLTGHDLAILGLLGLVQLPLALSLFIAGARTVPAAEVALLSLIETVLGPLWAWIGVGEVPRPASFVGGALVIVAVVLNSALGVRDRQARPLVDPSR